MRTRVAPRQSTAHEDSTRLARRTVHPAEGPRRDRDAGEIQSRTGALAGADSLRPHAALAVRVSARRRRNHGLRSGRTPVSGIRVQACGDAHLMNFGGFATPERHLIFDVNDFDETLPAPWEWDLKRLVASVTLAGRHRVSPSGRTPMRPWPPSPATASTWRSMPRCMH